MLTLGSDGSLTWISVNSQPLFQADGTTLAGVVASFEDITERKRMEEALRQLGVVPIPATGEEFDPRYHEALGSVEREDLPDHFVADEIRRGYKLRDRLLRPSMVRVVSNPKQQKE